MADYSIKIGIDYNGSADAALESTGKKITGIKDNADNASKSVKQLSSEMSLIQASDKVFKTAGVGFAALTAAATLATKSAISFNTAWQKVATLSVAQDRIDQLKESIQGIAPAVARSTDELTAATYTYISAFGDTSDTVRGVEIAAKAAAVGLASVDDALRISSAVTKAWGDTSAAAQEKSLDLANEVLRLGQTTFPEYANSIQRVTSASASLGVTQEELAAVFSSSTGVIGGAAEVSTQLRSLFSELIKPADTLKQAIQALGYETGEQLIAARGLGGALQDLSNYAKSANTPLVNLFGSVESGQAALYLAGNGAEKFASDLEAMNKAAGATERAFDVFTKSGKNTEFMLNQISVSAGIFSQKIGQELLNSLNPIIAAVSQFTQFLASLDQQTIAAAVSIGKATLAYTAGIVAIAGYTKAMEAAKKAQAALNVVISKNPIGAIATAVIALTVAIVGLYRSYREAAAPTQNMIDLSERFRAGVKQLGAMLKEVGSYIKSAFLGIMDNLNKGFQKIKDGIANILSGNLLKSLTDNFKKASASSSSLFKNMTILSAVLGVVQLAFTAIISFVDLTVSAFLDLGKATYRLVDGIVKFFTDGPKAAAESFKLMIKDFASFTKEAEDRAKAGISSSLDTFLNRNIQAVEEATKEMGEIITDAVSGGGDGGSGQEKAKTFWEWFKSVLSDSKKRSEALSAAISETFGVYNSIQDTVLMYYDKQLEALEARLDAEKAALDERHQYEQGLEDERIAKVKQDYADGILNLWEYNQALAGLESEQAANDKKREEEQTALEKKHAKERAEIEKKQFEAQKASDIAGVLSSAATAIMSAWAAYAGIPFVGAGIAGALTGVIAGVSAAQIAIIASQKYQMPAYASGTDYHKGGMALVGEEGAEIVNLPRGSSVMNNSDTLDYLDNQGMTFNNTFNIGVASQSDVAELARQVSYYIGQQVSARA